MRVRAGSRCAGRVQGTRGAWPGAMHAISYQLKRGHLCAVAIGRKIFRGTKKPDDPDYDGVPDMTPARFDILYLVLGRKMGPMTPAPRSIAMSELVRRLGLARATISKAVKRLVELGLVTCSYAGSGRRDKRVELTEEGAARIKRAMHLVFTGRQLARHYRRYIAKQHLTKKKNLAWHIAEELSELWFELRHLARHLFDRSDVLYNVRADPDH